VSGEEVNESSRPLGSGQWAGIRGTIISFMYYHYPRFFGQVSWRTALGSRPLDAAERDRQLPLPSPPLPGERRAITVIPILVV
jgi:hypothetical protein